MLQICKGPKDHYRLPLEKLIDYLDFAYHASEIGYPIFFCSMLCQQVVDVFKQKHKSKEKIKLLLVTEYLDLLEKYSELVNGPSSDASDREKENFSLIKTLCGFTLNLKLHQKISTNDELLDVIKKYLLIAQKYNLQAVKWFCEKELLKKLPTPTDASLQSREIYNKLFALSNQFNLKKLKEACENLQQN